MDKHFSSRIRLLASLAIAATLAPAWAAAPAGPTAKRPPSVADTRYEKERQVCLDGRSNQERATCLKEAGAARDEARRSQLDGGESAAQRAGNALQRCKAVRAADRADCERMARGEGSVSGSVGGGGVVKEIVTTVPAPEPAKAP